MKIPRDVPTAALVRAIEANELEPFSYVSRLPGGEFHRARSSPGFSQLFPTSPFMVLSAHACLPMTSTVRSRTR